MINIFGLMISDKIINTILIVVIGYLIYRILLNIINKSFSIKMKRIKFDSRRQKTVNSILDNILKYAYVIITTFAILGVLGVDASAIVASIGIIGLAVGLAVQDILKDILSGIFILIENQFAIGDVVMIGTFKGEVISLGLKTTKLRSETGEIKILSNRNISEIINYSLCNVKIFFDVDLDYDNDVSLIENEFINLASRLSKSIKNIKGSFKYQGIQKLGDKTTYRLSVEADPHHQDDIKREVWLEIKKTIDENRIRR
jgi:small conductance mechanosensitive channel